MPGSNLSQRLGCYGKLPCTGDFFHRNLPAPVIRSWEQWLKECIFESQENLGDTWTKHYLTCPFWRFYLPPGLIASDAYLGVMGPSLDSVGRYFPVTVFLVLPSGSASQIFSRQTQNFLEHIEETILKALDQKLKAVDNFLHACGELNFTMSSSTGNPMPAERAAMEFGQGWQFSEVVSTWFLYAQSNKHSWWWCDGNRQRHGILQQLVGLPDQFAFTQMLMGRAGSNPICLPEPPCTSMANSYPPYSKRFAGHLPINASMGRTLDQQLDLSASLTTRIFETDDVISQVELISDQSDIRLPQFESDDPLASVLLLSDSIDSFSAANPELQSLQSGEDIAFKLNQDNCTNVVTGCSSVHFSETGPVRARNEDSFLAMPDVQFWVIADGMGGHSFGEYASQEITKQLSLLKLEGTLNDRVRLVQTVLQSVNETVMDFARSKNTTCGSTVVAVLIENLQGAVIWAGDSRLYLLSDGQLVPMTRDHDGTELDPLSTLKGTEGQTNLISRAVGVTNSLETDVHYFPIKPSDRLLLCSDGVYGCVNAETLRQILVSNWDLKMVKGELQRAIHQAGADDNFTAVIIDIL